MNRCRRWDLPGSSRNCFTSFTALPWSARHSWQPGSPSMRLFRCSLGFVFIGCFLHPSEGTSFLQWIEEASNKYEAERAGQSKERAARLADLRNACLEIRKDIDKVNEALSELQGPTFDDRLASYRKWAREVGRYSFRWHLRAEA